MHYLLTDKDSEPPAAYSELGFTPTVPGADWFVHGRRYRETAREQIENGDQTTTRITLERADADPALGYSILDQES